MSAGLHLLLHLHQPDYRMPDGGLPLLPWVRLHAVRGYLDLLRVLESNPRARCCVNFSCVLLEQLDYLQGLFASGITAVDSWAALSLKDAELWDSTERLFAFRHFFSAHGENLIRPLPRYWELLQRKQQLERDYEPQEACEKFSPADYTDLALLFNLAWIGFSGQRLPEVQQLRQQGSGYVQAQIGQVLRLHGQLTAGILSAYAGLQDAGQIEISFTPGQHPILPLLCDLAAYAHPDADDPLPQFRHADDALRHIQRGQAEYHRHFGSAARGVWPAEGSVSNEVLGLLAGARLSWCATDQANLPAQGNLAHAQPWRWQQQGQEIAVFFRDTRLSDNIGFVYSHWQPREAVEHFLQMVASTAHSSGLASPVVSVILDGENPWENYPDGGEAFLGLLFERLAEHPELRSVLPAELAATAGNSGVIDSIHAGSWIGGNFRIWSRHAETRSAWRQLARARETLSPYLELEGVLDDLLAAEASDWFWWYGDDFVASGQELFDQLFRSRLLSAYSRAGLSPPPELLEPICRVCLEQQLPEAETLLDVDIDGRLSHWLEWRDAVKLATGGQYGSMALASKAPFAALHYGFSASELLLRLDPEPQLLELLRSGLLKLELYCEQEDGPQVWQIWPANGARPLRCALRDFLECALPLGAEGLQFGQIAWLHFELRQPDQPAQRFPASGRIGLRVIDRDFRLRHWSV
ncbi:hypothetical protein IT575_10520 [bacterium]|nr:hypothetical protein [bacterium]